MFIFVSLAFVKRYAELRMLGIPGVKASQGRGYMEDEHTAALKHDDNTIYL